jgi:hypothetical protein
MKDQPAPAAADDLDGRSDEDLSALIARASQILEARDRERKKQALEQIRQIAKTHGLAVNIGDAPPRRKRGRPRKQPES